MIVGILLLLNAHGAYIMQPLPNLPRTVCIAHVGDRVAQCWQAETPIDGTPGYETRQFTITLETGP